MKARQSYLKLLPMDQGIQLWVTDLRIQLRKSGGWFFKEDSLFQSSITVEGQECWLPVLLVEVHKCTQPQVPKVIAISQAHLSLSGSTYPSLYLVSSYTSYGGWVASWCHLHLIVIAGLICYLVEHTPSRRGASWLMILIGEINKERHSCHQRV